jgi:hypothetical protein
VCLGKKNQVFYFQYGEALKEHFLGQAPVAHKYNPSYSGGRDQEDHDLKPAQANSSQDPISKIANIKMGSWNSSSWYSPCLAGMRP